MDDFPDPTDPLPLPPPALLHQSLRLVPDPRDQRRPKHALPDLLFISLCSLLTGGDSFHDMADFASDEAAWLRTVIPFEGGPPSHDTFTRVFALLDTHAFEGAVRHWMRQLLPFPPPPRLPAPGPLPRPCGKWPATGKSSGEPPGPTRSPANGRYLALCERETLDRITGKVTIGRRFFLTSLKPEAEPIARCVRQHWQVENNLHWRLDVILREDFQRCRSGYAATNLSLIRKMSLHLLLKASPPGLSLKRMRLRAASKLDHLAEIIAPLLENDPDLVNA